MTKLDDGEWTPEQIAIEKFRLDQPDPMKILAGLIAIMADAPRAEKHLKLYAAEKEKADRAKASLADAKAKHDEVIAASTAELEAARAELATERTQHAARVMALANARAAFEASEERRQDELNSLRDRLGIRTVATGILGSGMTQEFLGDSQPSPFTLAGPINTIVRDPEAEPRVGRGTMLRRGHVMPRGSA
jgi:hypothetical protein